VHSYFPHTLLTHSSAISVPISQLCSSIFEYPFIE